MSAGPKMRPMRARTERRVKTDMARMVNATQERRAGCYSPVGFSSLASALLIVYSAMFFASAPILLTIFYGAASVPPAPCLFVELLPSSLRPLFFAKASRLRHILTSSPRPHFSGPRPGRKGRAVGSSSPRTVYDGAPAERESTGAPRWPYAAQMPFRAALPS